MCTATMSTITIVHQGRVLLKNSVLDRSSRSAGYITKLHQMQSAVMVHWESSEKDEESGWFVILILTSNIFVGGRLL